MKKLFLITVIFLLQSFQSNAKVGDKYKCTLKQSFMYNNDLNEFYEIPQNTFKKADHPILFWNKDTIGLSFYENNLVTKPIIKQKSNKKVDSFFAVKKYRNNSIEAIRFKNSHMVKTTNTIGSHYFIGTDTYDCKKLN